MVVGQRVLTAAGVSRSAISVLAAGDRRPATRGRPCASGRPRMSASGRSRQPMTPAHDGFSGQPGANLQPGPAAAGAVGVGEVLEDDAFDSGAGVVEHPGAGDGEVGGHGHQHETVWQLPAQKVIEEGAAGGIGLRAHVGARRGQGCRSRPARRTWRRYRAREPQRPATRRSPREPTSMRGRRPGSRTRRHGRCSRSARCGRCPGRAGSAAPPG